MSEDPGTALTDDAMARFVVCQRVAGWSDELDQALQSALKRRKGSKDTSDEVIRSVWEVLGTFNKGKFGSCSKEEEHRVVTALRRLVRRARRLEGHLLNDPEALELAYVEEQRKRLLARDARQQFADERRIFNRHVADADYAYWVARRWWTLEEAVTLTYGKDPRKVVWGDLKHHRSFSPWVRAYQERLDLVQRAARGGEISDPVRPKDFARWANEHDLDPALPTELVELATGKKRTVRDSDHIHHHTLHAFYAVLLGTAIWKYGLDPDYDPDKEGSDAFSSLRHDIGSAGLPVSAATLRKHTKAAQKWARAEGIKLKRPPRVATP